jgi:hypothetical protein
VHQVTVEPQRDRAPGQGEGDLALGAGDQDMAVTMDFAVDLDGFARGQHQPSIEPWQCRGGGFLSHRAGPSHGQVGQMCGQETGAHGAHQMPVQHQVDAAQPGPDGQGPAGQSLVHPDALAAGHQGDLSAGRDTDLELHRCGG